MANEVKAKYGSPTALTITLAALASSTAGVGRQSTMVDNSSTKHTRIKLFVKIRQGTSPTGDRGVYIYVIRGDQDGTPHRSDGAGASDAALTVQNAQMVGSLRNKTSPATGDDLYGEFEFDSPGPEWGVAVVHDTGVNLDADAGDHYIRYVGVTDEVQ